MQPRFLLASLLLLAACSDNSTTSGETVGTDTSAGSADTSDGSADTGSGSADDTGTADTGTADTGAQDSGSSDTGSGSADDTGTADTGTADTGAQDSGSSDTGSAACVAGSAFDPALFLAGGLTTPITEESCTLSSGATTTCYKLVFKGAPADHAVGPFCPRTITDGPEAAGIWVEDGLVYDVTGAFIANLATFYNDPAWQLYDTATGAVHVTDTQAACEAAARPDVDPAYNNYCVECSLDYFGGGITQTILIPKVPVPRATPGELGNAGAMGVAFNGITFDPPAPVAAILGAHTIAAFDDCGGHINPGAGYHYHAATGCSTSYPTCDEHAPLIGFAHDGYPIYAMTGADGIEPADLDACRGHEDAIRGYHYHVAGPGENLFIGCFHGDYVAAAGPGGGGGGGGPDPVACAPGQTSRCCGDGVCDGPETNANCAADCP